MMLLLYNSELIGLCKYCNVGISNILNCLFKNYCINVIFVIEQFQQ